MHRQLAISKCLRLESLQDIDSAAAGRVYLRSSDEDRRRNLKTCNCRRHEDRLGDRLSWLCLFFRFGIPTGR